MKSKDVARKHGFDADLFDEWLRQSGYQYKSGLTGLTVDDGLADELARQFNQSLAEARERLAQERKRVEEEQAAAVRAAEDKKKALASMLVTSGFSFDGYTITKYSGYISGDDAVSVDRPSQDSWGRFNKDAKDAVGRDLLNGLVQIRRNALAELKEAAYALGCNAVIGVDFDYITLDPETSTTGGATVYLPFLFCVTANGNAVIIEKNERTDLG